MPKKKVTEEGAEMQIAEEEPVVPESEPQPNPLDKVIAEAPELADVIKNPWLYTEWLNKLKGAR